MYKSLMSKHHNYAFELKTQYEQMAMFDTLGMPDSTLFSWEWNSQSTIIVITDISKNTILQLPFDEYVKRLRKKDAEKLKAAVGLSDEQKRKAISLDLQIKRSGSYRPYRLRGMAYRQESGIYAAGFAYDMKNACAQAERLDYLEKHDTLTGLINSQTMETLFEDVAKYGMYPQTLIVAHIDRFKEINDALGYHSGNTLIKNVADVLSDCFFDAEIVARIGGGEYCAVYAGKSHLEIDNKIKQARMMLHGVYLNLIKTEVSFGYAVACKESDFSVLYKQAVERIIRSRNVQKILKECSVIDNLNSIIEKRAGWGRRPMRLQSLSTQIASCLGCSEDCINEVKILAKIVDIGMIGIDQKLLEKRSSLTADEKDQYKNHIEIGRGIVSSINEVAGFEELYLDVYRRYDEWQDAVALSSRIIAGVMGFDEIVSSSASVSLQDIKERLKKRNEYCPAVVDAILGIAGKHYA